MTHLEITLNMAEFALKSTRDFLADADNAKFHGDMETLEKALETTCAKLQDGEPSPASQAFYIGTYELTWSNLSPLIGCDLEVLHWRLFDLEGRLNSKDLARWDWPPERMI